MTRWFGLAVLVGGAMWIFKGSVILLGLADPGWMVNSSQALLALSVPALVGLAGARTRRLGRVALSLAYACMALSSFYSAYKLLSPPGEYPIYINVATALHTLSLIVGLICAGVAIRTAPVRPVLLRTVPLALGVAFVPVLVALASLVHEEAPIILLGLGWIGLGALLQAGRREDGAPYGAVSGM